MKPNFALSFTDDSVTLLHRTARGWLEIGTVRLDAPDLEEALTYLRRSALGLAPHGVTTRLLIPGEMILWVALDAPGPGDEHRMRQIRRALDGRTPYPVDDLVFDWSGEGHHVQVAVVARETLREAEAFACQFHFNPVSFGAFASPGQFAGEPWFGPTSCAAEFIPQGEELEREGLTSGLLARAGEDAAALPAADAIISAGAIQAPEPELIPEPEAGPYPHTSAPTGEFQEITLADQASGDAAVADPFSDPLWQEVAPPAPPPGEPLANDPAPVLPGLPEFTESVAAPEPAAAPVSPSVALPADPSAHDLIGPDQIAPLRPALTSVPDEDQRRAAALAVLEHFHSAAPSVAEAEPTAGQTQQVAPVSPMPDITGPDRSEPAQITADLSLPAGAADIPEADPHPGFAEIYDHLGDEDHLSDEAGAHRPDEAGPTEADDTEAPFANISEPAEAAPPAAAAPISAEAGPGPRIVRPVAAEPEQDPENDPFVSVNRVAGRARAVEGSALQAGTAQPQLRASRPTPAPAGRETPPGRHPGLIRGRARAESLAAARTPAPPAPGLSTDPTTGPATGLAARLAAAAVPGFGKSLPDPASVGQTLVAPPPPASAEPIRDLRPGRRGKPRFLGLMLTAILLIVLAAVGVWSSVALSRNSVEEEPLALASDQSADAAAQTVAPAEPATPPAVSDTDTAAGTGTTAADGLPPEETSGAAAEAAAPDGDAPPQATDDPGQQQARPASQDEILITTLDAAPTAGDALMLAQAQTQSDLRPIAPVPPPPRGTRYEFDANGLIRPTEEGIITPQGYLLVAGKPPKVPPLRPQNIGPQSIEPQNTPVPASVNASAISAAPPPGSEVSEADPALAGLRPRARPEGLAPAQTDAPVAPADEVSLAIPPESRMASRLPQARPASIAAMAAAQAASQILPEDAARLASAAASLSAGAASAASPQVEDPQAGAIAQATAGPLSPLAVAISRRPPQKPRGFDRQVQAAVSAAAAAASAPVRSAAASQPAPPAVVPRTAIPGEDDEPAAPAAAAPRIPTKASVAQRATYTDAINLRKINLIGVYGAANKRYALVRLGNGQYKKVRVGDRIDGGTIAAITDSEVRYSKSGRIQALTMPRS